jgi:hypothetical protein
LAEPGIEFVIEQSFKPCAFGPVMQVADAEVLLDDVSDFRDGFVALDLQLGQLGGRGVLTHDAIIDLIESQEVPVGLTAIALVRLDIFNLALGMATVNRAVRQKVGIVDRGRSEDGRQHKAVFGIHRNAACSFSPK